MPTGIQVIGASGSVQIDENYRNLALREKGTHANPPVNNGQGLVAYKYNSAVGDTYDWWRFDEPQFTQSNYGLQLFDANGNVIFDATQKYARMVDLFPGHPVDTVTRTYPAGRTYAVITAKRGLIVERQVRPDPESGHPWYNYRTRFITARAYVSGNQVVASWWGPEWHDLDTWSPPIQVIPNTTAPDRVSQFIVVDVTNY